MRLHQLVAFAFLVVPVAASGATYHVRTDGGTGEQCDGTVDAAYPGSGAARPCAWAHPFWALDGNGAWKIKGGDTLVIANGSYMLGYGAPNTGWCDAGGAFDCTLPALPSGPSDAVRTRIVGAAWAAGCPAKPELWGTQRAWQMLNLNGTSNAEIACLEITDHSSCVEFHASPQATCERDAYPYGDWAGTGIAASASSHVTLRDLDIHGLAHTGVNAGGISDWLVENVRIAANGWVGWDGDLAVGDDSNSGTLTFRRWLVEWSGCAETYPGKQPDHCWAQSAGGYGDGIGTAATGGDWVIEDSTFRYNTSDGLDLLYLGRGGRGGSATVRRSASYGNAGNQMKIGASATLENVLLVGSCGFFHQKPFAQEFGDRQSGDHCRAGGNTLALSLHRGDRSSVVNATIVGQGDVIAEVTCDESNPDCDGSERVLIQNSVLAGYGDFLSQGDATGLLWDPSEIATGGVDYNVIHNVKAGECPAGAHDLCGQPKLTDESLASFDGHLKDGSPALDNGLAVGALDGLVPAEDLEGAHRPYGTGVDRGAYERGGAIPDGGMPQDAAGSDAATTDDAGGATDAGTTIDAETFSDAGGDAGTLDGGAPITCGTGTVLVDGACQVADAGTPADDAGKKTDPSAEAAGEGGCSCAIIAVP